ncbi:hypothetical protein [Prosthecobacter vanneervenii]|uniref:Uncharacterized protein n=1 Tax=Prosthecobacter vanneervenii TaxID=48466 RepID=A0A7W8DM00_9BACT|nr:hypothetical protein [Prosthecobacter vanneervenii]MBB5034697.1 hypothetical protein [Prosthecobacter vanneervenii]
MKTATFILLAASVLSSCTGGGSGVPGKGQVAKDQTVFSWLSTTAVTPTVAR